MKINIYSWVSRMSYAFQYTTIKMIIFCTCKNLLNNKKKIDKDTKVVVLKGHDKFLMEGNP